MASDDTPETPTPTASTGRSRSGRYVPWILVLVLGVALVAVTLQRSTDHSASRVPVVILPTARNASIWKLHSISRGGPDRTQPEHRMVVTNGQFRVESQAANTARSRREVWTAGPDLHDADVTVRIDQPSALAGNDSPQPGIALRTSIRSDGSGSAIVLDGNIWGYDYTNLQIGLWSWPSDFNRLNLRSLGKLRIDEWTARIIGTQRVAGHPATDLIGIDTGANSESPPPFQPGDRVDISTGLDHSFTQSNVEVEKMFGGILYVKNTSQTAASPRSLDAGTVTFHQTSTRMSGTRQSLYPRYVRARVVGDVLQVKSWLVGEPEPAWQMTIDLSGFNDVPESGQVGLITNHLHGAGQYIAFGDVNIAPLSGP